MAQIGIFTLGVVGESLERIPHMWEIESLGPGQVKPMTYKNSNLSLPSLALGINTRREELVSSVLG